MRTCHICREAVSEGDLFCSSCDAALLPPGTEEVQSGGEHATAPPEGESPRRKKRTGKLPGALDIYGDRPRTDVCQKCKKRSVRPGETICSVCSGSIATVMPGELKPVEPKE